MEENQDILVVGECNCGCGCGEVELRTEHQPEVLLFDEYAELYENDILHISNVVDELDAGVAREENATDNRDIILAKIADEHATTRSLISTSKEAILAVANSNSGKLDTLLARTISFPTETTEADINSLF